MTTYAPERFIAANGYRRKETAEWLGVKDAYALHLAASGTYSKATRRTYLSSVPIFASWCELRHVPFVAADKTSVSLFIAWHYEHRTRSLGTNRMLALRNFYRWAVEEGLRSDDPTAGMKARRDKKQPQPPFTDGELRKLLRAAFNLRDRVLLIILLSTGARRDEVVSMQVQDVDWGRQTILIRRGKGGKERRVGMSVAVMSELRALVGTRTSGPIWLTVDGAPMTGQQLLQQVKLISRRAEVSNAFPHRFRTTMANRHMKRSGDIAALMVLMGHSRIEMTQHYAEYSQAERALDLQRQDSLVGLVAGDKQPDGAAPRDSDEERELVFEREMARYRLKPYHLDALRLAAEGKSQRQIGAALGIGHGSVNGRLSYIKQQLGTEGLLQTCVAAAQKGLLREEQVDEEVVTAQGGGDDEYQHARSG